MKKVKFFALMLLAGAAMFTSCKKDETLPAATISVSNNTTTYTLKFVTVTDTSVLFNVTVTAEAEIESYSMKKTIGSTEVSYPATGDKGIAATGYTGLTSYTYHFDENFLKTETFPQTFKFSVTDKDGNTANVTVTVSKITGSSGTTLVYENISAILYNLMAPTGYLGAWDLVSNVGVASSGSETSKDMANKSTSGTGWIPGWSTGTGNTTAFVKDNSLTYATATLEDITAAYTSGSSSITITPTVGDIYVAKLRGASNYALIKVTAINTTASDNLDNITFTYKKLAQ